jgi:hypothetical protein
MHFVASSEEGAVAANLELCFRNVFHCEEVAADVSAMRTRVDVKHA